MRWSWKIGTVAGIPIFIHSTFVLILLWIGWLGVRRGQDLAATLGAVGFILFIFGCVLLHELGHALTAARFGIGTRDITLLPIGGLARLETMSNDPRREFWIALAGPAVNVAIAALALFLLFAQGAAFDEMSFSMTRGGFLERIVAVNAVLVIFNMLPAFPMDGGRVLRAMLAMRLDYARATRVAARIGQFMALAFAVIGLMFNPVLVFIAVFVWIGASQEAGMVQVRSALSGISVHQAMITEFHTLEPGDRLADAVALTLSTAQKDFPVFERGRVVGMLTQARLFRSLAEGGQEVRVETVMDGQFATADVGEMIEPVLERLQAVEGSTVVVLQGGALVGIVTTDNVGEFVRIRNAIDAEPRGWQPPRN